MSNITITDLDDELMTRLKQRSEANGRTVEEEAKSVLAEAMPFVQPAPENLAETIRSIVEPLGGFELELPARGFAGDGPWFGWQEEWDEKDDNS